MIEETIKEIVKAAIFEAMIEIEITKSAQVQTNNEVMTTKQLAEYLQCSIPWLTKNIIKLNIPHRRMGQVYRFKKDEIDSWLANKEHNKIDKVKIKPIKIKQTEMKIV